MCWTSGLKLKCINTLKFLLHALLQAWRKLAYSKRMYARPSGAFMHSVSTVCDSVQSFTNQIQMNWNFIFYHDFLLGNNFLSSNLDPRSNIFFYFLCVCTNPLFKLITYYNRLPVWDVSLYVKLEQIKGVKISLRLKIRVNHRPSTTVPCASTNERHE